MSLKSSKKKNTENNYPNGHCSREIPKEIATYRSDGQEKGTGNAIHKRQPRGGQIQELKQKKAKP